LGSKIEVTETGKGILIKTGATPPEGDINNPNGDIDPLRIVGCVLSGITLKKWQAALFGVSFEVSDAWLHRFE
jgi:hypothetical protein